MSKNVHHNSKYGNRCSLEMIPHYASKQAKTINAIKLKLFECQIPAER